MPLDLSKTATKLLSKLGSKTYVKLIRKVNNSFDPVSGSYPDSSVSEISLTGIVSRIADGLIDGERIKDGDKQVIFDNSVTPLMTDVIKFDNKEYTITFIDGYNHAGTQQYWKVNCRA